MHCAELVQIASPVVVTCSMFKMENHILLHLYSMHILIGMKTEWTFSASAIEVKRPGCFRDFTPSPFCEGCTSTGPEHGGLPRVFNVIVLKLI